MTAILGLCVVLVSGCSGGSGSAGEASGSPSAASATPGQSDTVTDPSASSSTAASESAVGTAAGARYALFFGDSNFVGGGCTPDAQQDMARIAGDQLGYRSVIRGAGGTGYVRGNPDYGLPNFVAQVDNGALATSPAPQLVVIEGGSNDTGLSAQRITRNAVTVVRDAQSTYPDARVVVMGPIDVRAGQGDVTPEVVDAVRSAAATAGVPFLDAYAWLPWRTTQGLVCSDYDHATHAGHEIIGRRLADALSQVGA